MAKPAKEINPKSAKNLKQLCHDTGITQAKLSELSGITQNTISKIVTGKSPLTHNVAMQIVEVFPMYRAEWLEGIDDEPMVTGGQFLRSALKVSKQSRVLHDVFLSLAVLCGYVVTPVKSDVTAPNGVLHDAVTEYAIAKGRKTISVKEEELSRLEDEILDFAELKIRHFFAQKGENMANI